MKTFFFRNMTTRVLALALLFTCTQCFFELNVDRGPFLGTFDANENCPTWTDTYTMEITVDPSSDDGILLGNLYGIGASPIATVTDEGTFVFSAQTFGDLTYSGSGSVSGNTLSVDFRVSDDSGGSIACTVLGTRR